MVILTFFSLVCFYQRCLARYYADSCFYFAISDIPGALFICLLPQSVSRQIQIGKGTEHKQGIGIFVQSTVTNLGESKHAFDHSNDMLHLGPDFRLGSVACLGRLIQRLIATALLVGEILGSVRHLVNDLRLNSVSRITPYPFLLTMQQFFTTPASRAR
jgi:hypothetical protein